MEKFVIRGGINWKVVAFWWNSLESLYVLVELVGKFVVLGGISWKVCERWWN